jgi:hypothetical protein
VSIGTDVVVSACTICTDGETQQQVQPLSSPGSLSPPSAPLTRSLTAVPDADADADPDPNPNPNPNQLHIGSSSYDESLVSACRKFAGAHYDAGARGWRVPMRHREALERRLAELQRAGTIRKLQTMQTIQTAPPSPLTPTAAAAASPTAAAAAAAAAASAPPPPPPPPRSPRSPQQPPPQRQPPPPQPLLLPLTLEGGLLPHQRVAVEF